MLLSLEPTGTRAVEFLLDSDEMTAKRVWDYGLDDDGKSYVLGSIQYLEDGRIVVNWGSRGLVERFSVEREPVWGMSLDAGIVKEARSKEIGYVRDKRVWTIIPRSTAKARGWKVIKTRWIDINKGDDANPICRSRLVGKEFNNEVMDGIVAGTPPLEALRALVHEAATIRK